MLVSSLGDEGLDACVRVGLQGYWYSKIAEKRRKKGKGATSFIERVHGGRFIGKYSTFGQNDNFAKILRFKEVGDPHFFAHNAFFDKLFRLSKHEQKINVGTLFFFHFSTPARSKLCEFGNAII